MEEYTNRELGLLIVEIKKDIDVQHDHVNESIVDMNDTLKKHNGRLSKVEVWINRSIGALVIISVIVSSLLFPLIIRLVTDNKASDAKIKEQVSKAIEEMNLIPEPINQ